MLLYHFFLSSRRRHTRWPRDWSSDVCSSDLGENFMILLASRLDAVVFQIGLAKTRRQARQLVNHGHITVDGGRVDIPSRSEERRVGKECRCLFAGKS